jgi:hypothetical protein
MCLAASFTFEDAPTNDQDFKHLRAPSLIQTF